MKCVLIGGGGHGRVLLETLSQARPGVVTGVVDAQPGLQDVFGVRVLGGDEVLPNLRKLGFTHFVIGVGSVKSCTLRTDLFEMGCEAGLEPLSVIHPASYISPTAELGLGCQVMARAVVNTGARLAAHVLVNCGAVVEHDCVVGEHVHIATGAVLCGGVSVGQGAHIGAGAVVRQGISIGEGAVVGAGAVVVRNVTAGAVVAGVPARPLS